MPYSNSIPTTILMKTINVSTNSSNTTSNTNTNISTTMSTDTQTNSYTTTQSESTDDFCVNKSMIAILINSYPEYA